ncbi:MAG: cell division protein ZapA [Chakrabartia sp.]
MAKVDLVIGGNSYTVACRDGEEPNLTKAAALVDAKAQQARQALGGVSEVRQLLFASLLLADDLAEARPPAPAATPAPPPPAPADAADNLDAELLEDIADRLESLARRLEQRG